MADGLEKIGADLRDFLKNARHFDQVAFFTGPYLEREFSASTILSERIDPRPALWYYFRDITGIALRAPAAAFPICTLHLKLQPVTPEKRRG